MYRLTGKIPLNYKEIDEFFDLTGIFSPIFQCNKCILINGNN